MSRIAVSSGVGAATQPSLIVTVTLPPPPQPDRVIVDRAASDVIYGRALPVAINRVCSRLKQPPRFYAVAGKGITSACFVATGAKLTFNACATLCSWRR